MKLVLTPLAPSGLDPIVITERLFAVGRRETPFDRYDASVTASLANRHARIFEERGRYYLIDLNSPGGSSLNGRPLEKNAALLQPGDEVGFGRQLRLRVTISDEETEPEACHPGVTLRPLVSAPGLEPIVVTQLPFLIGKSRSAFAAYRAALPAETEFLSRRHALLFSREGSLYLDDLNSLNGTFVNGKRLGDGAVQLREGDRIGFGGDTLAFSVAFGVMAAFQTPERSASQEGTLQLNRQEAPTRRIAPVANLERTIFVSSADSFLDIFCQDQEEGPRASAADAKPPPDPAQLKRAKKIALVKGIRDALQDDKPRRHGVRWVLAGLVLGGGLLATYHYTRPERDIEHLLDTGRHAEGLAKADAYLKTHPDSVRVRDLATQALLKHLLPDWLAALERGDFTQARARVEELRQRIANNPDGLTYLRLLDWIGDLRRFVVERGGTEAPFRLFQEEKAVDDLLGQWEQDPVGNREQVTQMAVLAPLFEETRTTTFSQLRWLQDQQAVHVKASKTLEQTVRDALENGRHEDLPAALEDFRRVYPRASGVERLTADLTAYAKVATALKQQDLFALEELRRAAHFETPPFRAHVDALWRTRLPDEGFMAGYLEARAAWRDGQAERALSRLAELKQRDWDSLAARLEERYQSLQREAQDLRGQRGDAGYPERLLAFYQRLNPEDDAHWARAFAQEVQRNRQSVLERARKDLQAGRAAWEDYQRRGRIDGLLRLERSISADFRARAGLLSKSAEQIQRAVAAHALTQTPLPERDAELKNAVYAEAGRQRQWLRDMKLVLDSGLLEAKLALLPKPEN